MLTRLVDGTINPSFEINFFVFNFFELAVFPLFTFLFYIFVDDGFGADEW